MQAKEEQLTVLLSPREDVMKHDTVTEYVMATQVL